MAPLIALGRLGGSGGIGSSLSHWLRAPLFSICNREKFRSSEVPGRLELKASRAWNELCLHESREPCLSGRSGRRVRGDSDLDESRDVCSSGKRATLVGDESEFHESDVS